MGYVLKEFSNEGEDLELEVRGKRHAAKIFKMPFYKKKLRKIERKVMAEKNIQKT